MDTNSDNSSDNKNLNISKKPSDEKISNSELQLNTNTIIDDKTDKKTLEKKQKKHKHSFRNKVLLTIAILIIGIILGTRLSSSDPPTEEEKKEDEKKEDEKKDDNEEKEEEDKEKVEEDEESFGSKYNIIAIVLFVLAIIAFYTYKNGKKPEEDLEKIL
tara:strand:+ start:2070 stop:2546 length:477 start_codon:yes stop_codon:yes gene_type:complete